MAQPKRLPGISYNVCGAYFVTCVTMDRIKAFDLKDFGPRAVVALTEIAGKFGFDLSAYVVMPDHAHFLALAPDDGADFERMVKALKQKTGFEWSRRCGRRLWQKGYVDRVLRDDEAELSVCRYIIENPVRAKLVVDPLEYPLSGSTKYDLADICSTAQMKGWWSGA